MGQGLGHLCAIFGKWPHEAKECGDAEWAFLTAWWNEKVQRENDAMKRAGM